MVDFEYAKNHGFEDVCQLMRILREKCPWDAEQTHASIRDNMLEEACEAMEAIDNGDSEPLCEELGDVLLQVVFHATLAEESGAFDIGRVTDALCKKLIARHPHVFGDAAVSGVTDVLSNWEAIKRQKKGQATVAESMRGVAATLPPVMRAEKLIKIARRAGIDAPDAELLKAADAVRDAETALREACAKYMSDCESQSRL